jgi:cytochrome c556
MFAARTLVVGGLLSAPGVVLFLASCVQNTGGPSPLVDTGRPALHAIQQERLKSIMAEISRLAVERLPQEIDTSAMRDRKSEELADCATELADDAEAISDTLVDVRISAEDRRVFEAYVEKLRTGALEMADIARRHDARAMAAKYDEIMSTCNACHSSFRILPRVKRS